MTLNKAMLIGNLGRDPEVRYTQRGDAVANFTLATSEVWNDRNGQRQERTEWHNVVAWGGLADFVQNYLHKGKQVYVEGRLQTREWTDQNNQRHFRTEVVANSIRFVGPPPSGEGRQQGAPRQNQGGGPPQQGRGGGGGGGRQQPPQDRGGGGGNDQYDGPPQNEDPYMEDDIPF